MQANQFSVLPEGANPTSPVDSRPTVHAFYATSAEGDCEIVIDGSGDIRCSGLSTSILT